ncbi:hypothetical protein [Staphylothermus hellenicus]|uniref:Uncharacterized protein n=1 Tax=Staphylothermus hellenicus (strain DSM 12710 / JCM 10830 / BK20S6-10-b1 / P8) TaxID=591019 RepID=D7D911_STAHD|nr:hypothetical protein [Staphylothermus hellenicus]ADI32257.1 hypothetical protein Shell_1156 [Staphylothermus hellenicus DSM 12710]
MIDQISLAMIAIYLTLITIPLIYNNKYIKENNGMPRNKNNNLTYSHEIKPLTKSVIILLNNLNEKQLDTILKITKSTPAKINDERTT